MLQRSQLAALSFSKLNGTIKMETEKWKMRLLPFIN